MKSKVFWLSALVLFIAATEGAIDIHPIGNSFLSNRKVLEVIAPESDSYDTDGLNAWSEDAQFYVSDLYRASGFFDIQVKITLNPKPTDSLNWDAKLTIIEGPRYAFDSVLVLLSAEINQGDSSQHPASSTKAGLPVPSGAPITAFDLEAQKGKPFHEDALLTDERIILRTYGNAGYVRADVKHKMEVQTEKKTVAVEYYVDPSYPVVFDTLIIRTTRAPPADTAAGITRDALLRSLVPYKRGDTVRISQSDRIIEKLQYTGAFNYVRLYDSLQSDTTRGSILYLYAEEHVPGNAHSSIFYETEYGPGISGDLRHSNVSGTLNEVRVGASFAKSRQNVYTGFGSPLPFGYLVRFDNDAGVSWYQDLKLHADQGPLGGDFRATNSTRLTFPFAYWLRLVANAELEAKSLMLDGGLRERDLDINFIQTAFIAFLNQQMDPSRGMRFALTWGNGGPLVRGNVFDLTEYRHNWIEAQTAQYYYFSQVPQIKWAGRVDAGRFFGIGGSNSERFFLGGSRSVRSFDFQSLCLEKTVEGRCAGEKQSLAYYLASTEVRIEPFAFGYINSKSLWNHLVPIQVVPFVDYANLWDVRGHFQLDLPTYKTVSGFGYAYGMGIRYPLLGIFNLRMDFPFGNGPASFWLDLAQAF